MKGREKAHSKKKNIHMLGRGERGRRRNEEVEYSYVRRKEEKMRGREMKTVINETM